MTTTEKCKAIREALKAIGYNSRKVGVTHRYCGYSASIDITIKDRTIDRKTIEQIAYNHQSIDRDERTGEILAGGNTYVFVDYEPEIY